VASTLKIRVIALQPEAIGVWLDEGELRDGDSLSDQTAEASRR
jgi:Zn-finger nucleic acid-binding protein